MLSIVSITFQDPEGLRHTFDSLRALPRTGWEHVVVDSSPEVNAEILASLPADWPLVHVVTPARGIFPAMNEGIRRARGTFLWFLNGGDMLADTQVLEHGLKRLETDPSIDILSHGVWPTVEGRRLQRPLFPGAFYDSTPRADRKTIIGRSGMWHQGMLYRASVFERVGLYDEQYRAAGDYQHHWKCVLAGIEFELEPTVLANMDATGVSSNNYEVFRKDMAVLNQWLRPRLSGSDYIQHIAIYSVICGIALGRHWGARFPAARRVFEPVWQRIRPDRTPVAEKS